MGLLTGTRNGAFLGTGAALSFAFVQQIQIALANPLCLSREGLQLRPEAIVAAVAVAVVAVLAGALGGMLTRVLLRPFGRINWGVAWLLAGIAVWAGTSGVWQQWLPDTREKWQMVLVVLALPAGAVYWDWWTRFMRRETRSTAAAGKISPERGRILEGTIPVSDSVIKHLPLILLLGGVITGHFAGWAAGMRLASAEFAVIGADFGAMIGWVAGAMAAHS